MPHSQYGRVINTKDIKLVGTGGIEPPTPSVSGKCSPTELRACNKPRRRFSRATLILSSYFVNFTLLLTIFTLTHGHFFFKLA